MVLPLDYQIEVSDSVLVRYCIQLGLWADTTRPNLLHVIGNTVNNHVMAFMLHVVKIGL